MRVHTAALVSRLQSVPALAAKTFVSMAPNGTVAPYVIVHPADGVDTVERLAGPASTQHPRFTLFFVGSSYDNAATVTELAKAKFVDRGTAIQVVVEGERSGGLQWSSPQPVQVDNDVTPPLVYSTVEISWYSDLLA